MNVSKKETRWNVSQYHSQMFTLFFSFCSCEMHRLSQRIDFVKKIVLQQTSKKVNIAMIITVNYTTWRALLDYNKGVNPKMNS